jgi:lipid-binding SYLF domain-containing protein
MMKSLIVLAVSAVMLIGLIGCSTAPKSESDREQLVTDARATVDRMAQQDAGIKDFLKKAYGYAVFPSVGKGGVGVGGAYGRGVVFEQGNMIGYTDLSQASIGFQLGGQEYSELIAFENKAALDRFTTGKFEFAAQASAVALKAGASANANYRDGIAVFTAGESGLMYEASIGGQKFSFQRK